MRPDGHERDAVLPELLDNIEYLEDLMHSLIGRAHLVFFVILAFAACGGRTSEQAPGGSSGSSGSSGVSSSGACVDVDPSTYDQRCEQGNVSGYPVLT
jgi:hypothetical protein